MIKPIKPTGFSIYDNVDVVACLGCIHEVNDNFGGPDPDNNVCVSCEQGDMYNTGIYAGMY